MKPPQVSKNVNYKAVKFMNTLQYVRGSTVKNEKNCSLDQTFTVKKYPNLHDLDVQKYQNHICNLISHTISQINEGFGFQEYY